MTPTMPAGTGLTRRSRKHAKLRKRWLVFWFVANASAF